MFDDPFTAFFFYFTIPRLIPSFYLSGTRRTVVGMRPKVNNSDTANHRVCENGSWIYETIAG